MIKFFQQRLNARINKCPCTHVFWFFLAPDDFCVGKAIQLSGQCLDGERIELFKPHQVDIIQLLVFPLFKQIIIHFPVHRTSRVISSSGFKVPNSSGSV